MNSTRASPLCIIIIYTSKKVWAMNYTRGSPLCIIIIYTSKKFWAMNSTQGWPLCIKKQEVQAIFNVLSGDLPLSSVKNVLPEDMKKEEIDNARWTKLQNWKKWWTREEHLSKFTFSFPRLNDNLGNCIYVINWIALSTLILTYYVLLLFVLEMFTAAYTVMGKNWTDCPETTNPVEHINKDSIPRSKDHKKNLWSVVDNIYRCDKLAAAKRVAVTKNVTISYVNKEDDRTKSTARKMVKKVEEEPGKERRWTWSSRYVLEFHYIINCTNKKGMLTYTTVLNWKRQVENWVHKPEEEV